MLAATAGPRNARPHRNRLGRVLWGAAAAVLLAPFCRSASGAALDYRMTPGRVFGYLVSVAEQEGGTIRYHVGFPIFAVASAEGRAAFVATAARVEKTTSPNVAPPSSVERYTESISLRGGSLSLNKKMRSVSRFPGSLTDVIFVRLPVDPDMKTWGGRVKLDDLLSDDRGIKEHRCERANSSLIREEFLLRIESGTGKPKEQWAGSGETVFDVRRGLVEKRDLTMVHTSWAGGSQKDVPMRVTVRLLDDEALAKVARAAKIRLPGEEATAEERAAYPTTKPTGRWVHADTPFHDGQELLLPYGGRAFYAQVIGRPQNGNLRFRIRGSRAFWDGHLPPDKFQFPEGTVNPKGLNIEVATANALDRLLADLDRGSQAEATRAIQELAGMRPQQPDDKIAAALVRWIGRVERRHASRFSEAMQAWATPAVAADLVEAFADEDGVKRRIGRSGLLGVGAPAEGHVAQLLRHSDPDVRRDACSLLGRIGTARSLAALNWLAKNAPYVKVRQSASLAARAIQGRAGGGP